MKMAAMVLDSKHHEHILSTLSEMEHSWQTAVDKALSVREDQLSAAKQVILTLRDQIQLLEKRLQARDKEVDTLNNKLIETQTNLDSTREDMATLLETTQKQLEDQSADHARQLEAKDREMDELRTRHKQSIQELARGARETLHELELQMDELRQSEAEAQGRLRAAEEESKRQAKRLQDWDRVSDKMCHELDEAKGKLKSSKFANGKLREEIELWKKYAEKVEEERKAVRRDIELEKKVLQKFNMVESFLRTERQHRNIMLNSMNNFGINLMKDIKLNQGIRQSEVVCNVATTQTDTSTEWEEKEEVINILEQKNLILEEELRSRERDLENVCAQNATLREVIMGMKKERECWEREREQINEDAQVSKLEESVRLIKNNLINDQKDVCVWNALQGVKKEVSELKNRKVHNTAIVTRPTVIAKPVMKTNGGIPVLKEYVLNRNKVPLKF